MSQTEWHIQLTKEMALQALAFEVMTFIERMRTMMREAPGGSPPSLTPQIFSDVAIAQLPASAMLVNVLQRSILGGDPDGAPGKPLVDIKREILGFHQEAVKRLGADIEALEKHGGW